MIKSSKPSQKTYQHFFSINTQLSTPQNALNQQQFYLVGTGRRHADFLLHMIAERQEDIWFSD